MMIRDDLLIYLNTCFVKFISLKCFFFNYVDKWQRWKARSQSSYSFSFKKLSLRHMTQSSAFMATVLSYCLSS